MQSCRQSNGKKKERFTSALWGDYMYKVIHSNIVPPFFLYKRPNIKKIHMGWKMSN